MKKKSVSRSPIVVITGKQKHPTRHKIWKFFSQKHIKRLVITMSIVAFIFIGSVLVYANRTAVTQSIYAMFGLDLERLRAELEGGSVYVEDPDANEAGDSQQPAGSVAPPATPDDVVVDYAIEPEAAANETQPTATVSDGEVMETSEAAMVDPADNNEEEVYGGYDD